jgi:hypothetical protein
MAQDTAKQYQSEQLRGCPLSGGDHDAKYSWGCAGPRNNKGRWDRLGSCAGDGGGGGDPIGVNYADGPVFPGLGVVGEGLLSGAGLGQFPGEKHEYGMSG